MKKLMRAGVLLCCSARCWPQANVDLGTGKGYLRTCVPRLPSGDPAQRVLEDSQAPVDSTACTMYVLGVLEGINAAMYFSDKMDPGKGHRFICVPDGMTAERLRYIVIGYIQVHLGSSGSNTSLVELQALLEAFPCQAPKSPQP